MPFNYKNMQKIADKLLSDKVFGGPCILLRQSGTTYDPIKKKNINTYEEFSGNCVRKTYEDDGLGKLADIVKAGDLEFKLTLKDLSVQPEKNKDKIFFEGVTYNIIEVATANPNGKIPLVHTCYARKAS